MTDVTLYQLVAEGKSLDDANRFADITPSPWHVTDNQGELTIHFDQTLTDLQVAQVTWRATLTSTEEADYIRLNNLSGSITALQRGAGPMNVGQLSDAVHQLADAIDALWRIRLRDLG